MFSLVCALPSPASAQACASLFGRFTGITAQSDFSCTFMSAVRFMAFADRSCSFEQDVQEISRFSCMLFLSVRGFLDYAGPTAKRWTAFTTHLKRSAFYSPSCIRQYSLSGSSVSRSRVSSRKTTFNEAMHNENANTIITPNANHAPA